MPTSSADRSPMDRLAEEFAERYRRGERPSLAEYVERYPQHAGEIRELFPALVVMEQLKPVAGDPTGDFDGGSAPAESRPPERLGDYRILREVGRGGMGVVYEAEQISLGRRVALKVLPPHAPLNPTYLERFRREAKAAARLHHTNIVPVFGVGEEGGVHFYAMQFIRGEGLDRVLRDLRRLRGLMGGKDGGPPNGDHFEASVAQSLLSGQFGGTPTADAGLVPVPAAAPAGGEAKSVSTLSGGSEATYYRSVARVGLQAADALAYAHRQGVVHRDVKPSNLLLDAEGTVWVTDFGLAKAEGNDDLTHTGDFVGTLRYMAPERFDGRSLPQSDVYSLGLTLYELLTLRPAFDDTNKGRLIEKVLHEPPAPPRRLDARVPRDLETVVLKCVGKDPRERYATAEALAEDLRRFLADRPVKARRASGAERLWRWSRRNPVVASLLVVVGLLLATVAVVSTVAAVRTNDALGRTQKAEREARLREAEALIGQAHGIRYSHRSGQRFQALAALKKAAAIGRELGEPGEWFDGPRNEAIAALALPDLDITYSWNDFPPGRRVAYLSDDFELCARTTPMGACSIRRVVDNRELWQLPERGEPTLAWFGPGRLLVVSGGTSGLHRLWDLSGREPVQRLDDNGRIGSQSFNADGRLVAVGRRDGSIDVLRTEDGSRPYHLAPEGITRDSHPSLHPTRPVLAVRSSSSNLLQVRELETGTVLVSVTVPIAIDESTWSADGRTLAVSGFYNSLVYLYAYDPAAPGLRLTHALQTSSGGGTDIRFNPAGDRLAVRGWSGKVDLFDVITGRLLFTTKPLQFGNTSFMFDRTGKRLGAACVGPLEDQIGIWSVADAREYRAFPCDASRQTKQANYTPAIHPGGRLAVKCLPDGIGFWDLETGGLAAFVPLPAGDGNACFDGRGDLLINSLGGCFRWPVHSDAAQANRYTIGPPQRLPFASSPQEIAESDDGRVIAQATYGEGGWLLSPDSAAPRRLEAIGRLIWTDVTRDGRWVAYGGHLPQVNVYETASGKLAWQSPADKEAFFHSSCRFSRDGCWLATNADYGRTYHVGSWEPGPPLGPGIPSDISPDDRLVVMQLPDGAYRLMERATGRELARLEDPDQIAAFARFTPDGTRLVVGAPDGLRVWDLRLIRAELIKLDLDWDAPPYTEAPDASPVPLEVTVVGAESLPGANPMALNNEAWRLLTGPAGDRDPARAIGLIQEAIKLQPNDAMFLNTLGVAQYRNGQYRNAAATLERSLAAGKGQSDAYDLFFLAMCHTRLGEPMKAVDCFDRAVKWVDGQRDLSANKVEELKAIRAEAEDALKGQER